MDFEVIEHVWITLSDGCRLGAHGGTDEGLNAFWGYPGDDYLQFSS